MSDVRLGILFCFEANVVVVLTVESQREVECVLALSLLSELFSDISRLLLILVWSFLVDLLLLKGDIVLDFNLSMTDFFLLFDRIFLEDLLFLI